MPQLDPAAFLPQIFWLFILFGLIYLFVANSAAPKITRVLERRQDRIASDLEEAERLQGKAEEARAGYEKAMEEARARALATVTSKRNALKIELESKYSSLTGKLVAEAAASEEKIMAAKDRALDDIRAMSVDICRDIIRSVSGLDLDEKIVAPAVNSRFAALKEKADG